MPLTRNGNFPELVGDHIEFSYEGRINLAVDANVSGYLLIRIHDTNPPFFSSKTTTPYGN
ncbi:MAG: hypothetical protein ACYCZZ_02110 [Minisyncoccota bacterium]